MLKLNEYRICVTGGAGFLGRAVCRLLAEQGVAPDNVIVPRRAEFDLTQEDDVRRLYRELRPNIVIHLAAEVGGIGANMDSPGRFFYANMAMGLHLIEHARQAKIRKFVHTGTVCAYPKFTPVPFRETDLWNGYPEETNAPYGIAKKALFVMLDAYFRQYGLPSAVLVPVNLYGPGDNFDAGTSHVIPAIIRKCETAISKGDSRITCWGTGAASREFLYVDDAALAIVEAARLIEEPTPINLGTGREITIADLVELIAKICGFAGQIQWDATKPDGQPRRSLDITRAAELLHWKATMPLEEGLRRTIDWWRQRESCSPLEAGAVC